MRWNRAVFGGLLVVALLVTADWASARDVTVTLKNGSRYEGELISESPSGVRVRLKSGIEQRWSRDQIAMVESTLSLAEEFASRRKELQADDFVARYELAQEFYEKAGDLIKRGDTSGAVEAYQLSLAELTDILKVRPDHQRASFLRGVVDSKLKLAEKAENSPMPVKPESAPDAGGNTEVSGDAPRFVTEEEINLMKVFEVELDSRPRVAIPRETISEVLEAYRQDPVMKDFLGREGEARFKSMDAYRQLAVMFQLRAREYYSKVRILDEPKSFVQYRTLIHRNYLQRYCGSCHGQGKSQGLYLITQPPAGEKTEYTNLVILSHTQVKGQPLMSKDDPTRSLLLQYGLPTADAATPHPKVPGWRQFFSGTRDPRYGAMAAWMQGLYSNPHDLVPDYKLPGSSEATAVPAAETSDTQSPKP